MPQFNECRPTDEEAHAVEVARVGFMAASPFFAHIFYSTMKQVLTYDVPTACTDGRHVVINPKYLATLKPAEACFVFAHEMCHFVMRHSQRMKHYQGTNECNGLPWDGEQFNVAADYVINAMLIEEGVGQMNPSWLYHAAVTGDDVAEDVYRRFYQKPPPGQGQGPGGKGQSQGPLGKGATTFGSSGKAPKGAQRDKVAESQGGGFDKLLPPPTDAATGQEDAPDEGEFKEAIARAAAAAKAMGQLPARLQRLIDDILEPQVNWRDHVRLLLTGHLGARSETWDRPNRRRLVLNPIVIMPGRRGFGAELVVVGVDTSGSISERELSAFFAEVGGVLADVRPRRVMLIACDAMVQQVDEAGSLDELAHVRAKGLRGGGGTSFIPVFDYCEEHGLVPDTLIYLTDMLGSFPGDPPGYPVVWCATTDYPAPWGDVVRVKV